MRLEMFAIASALLITAELIRRSQTGWIDGNALDVAHATLIFTAGWLGKTSVEKEGRK